MECLLENHITKYKIEQQEFNNINIKDLIKLIFITSEISIKYLTRSLKMLICLKGLLSLDFIIIITLILSSLIFFLEFRLYELLFFSHILQLVILRLLIFIHYNFFLVDCIIRVLNIQKFLSQIRVKSIFDHIFLIIKIIIFTGLPTKRP